MEWFCFSEQFDGKVFYETYQNAAFLKKDENLCALLTRSEELKKRYSTLNPGKSLGIKGMFIKDGVPLVLDKSHRTDESDVDQNDFTLRRLLGLVAAYVYNNKLESQDFYSYDAERFGLKLNSENLPNPNVYYGGHNNSDYETKKMYYSAIFGAEYFYAYFKFYPFLFALRRFQLKQISGELLLAIANIQNNMTLKSLVIECASNISVAHNIAAKVGFNLQEAIREAPEDVKCFFKRSY